MPYSTAEAQQQLLDDLAVAIDEIGVALAALGEAYEAVDERSGDQLEQELFRPVGLVYARAQRTHGGFAARTGLPARRFEPAAAGRPSLTARDLLDTARDALAEADHLLTEIQDSMMPVEVGDAELRSGLAAAREQLGPLPDRAVDLQRVLGR